MALAASIAVAAWLPTASREAAPDLLPPVSALEPGAAAGMDLFGARPPLSGSSSLRDVWAPMEAETASLLFQHSPLGQSVREAVEVRYTRAP